MSQQRLEQLFKRCDTRGSGFIDKAEFRDLCAGFEIGDDDADVIFADLDHDGDGRISFDDFSFGFRDFLTPGARRGSVQLGLAASSPGPAPARQPSFRFEKMDSIVEVEAKQQEMERKHRVARNAWQHLADNLGKDDVRKFLGSSGDKIFMLYEELQTSEVPPHLMDHFQDLISALVVDVKKIDEKNKMLEERFEKERESHSTHLKNIEAELDAQMLKVEQQALEKAKQEYEEERRGLQLKMDAELSELQTQLKLFQKVDTWLTKEKNGNNHSKETQKKLETAVGENRNLKLSLNDTQTNIALLRAELGQIRSQYENKCSELSEERENRMEYMYDLENIHRQLDLLRNANQKLQDTNDGLVQMVDVSSLRSPRLQRRYVGKDDLTEVSSDIVGQRRKRTRRNGALLSGNTSDNYDSDSLRSRGSRTSERFKLTDTQFGLKRLLDDLDSGTSTLPVEDEMLMQTHDEYLADEEEEAIRVLETVVVDHDGPKSIEQRDRDLSEINVVDNEPPPKVKPTPAPRKNSSLMRRPSSTVRPKNMPILDLEATGPPDRTYKVVFAGDAAVGKTSFINRITKGIFVSNLSSTLGVDFQVKTIRVDERNIALQLWDTAGQERFRSVTRSYFRRADGVMLLYDVTNERSFLSVRQWIDAVDVLIAHFLSGWSAASETLLYLAYAHALRSNHTFHTDVSENRIPIMLCGNKIDLRSNLVAQGCRCVTTEDGERIARDHSATFLETSSKQGDHVVDALVRLSRDMCATEDAEVQTSVLKIREDELQQKKSCCGGSKS